MYARTLTEQSTNVSGHYSNVVKSLLSIFFLEYNIFSLFLYKRAMYTRVLDLRLFSKINHNNINCSAAYKLTDKVKTVIFFLTICRKFALVKQMTDLIVLQKTQR